MIHSMTGFGEARQEQNGLAYHLEIRTVNNRYFKAALHLSEEFAMFETELDRLLRERLVRGSITLRLHVRSQGPRTSLDINATMLGAYVDKLRAAGGDDPRMTIDLATLLTLPGVCQPPEVSDEERARRWTLLTHLLDAALEQLLSMRAAEGRALADDLSQHCADISTRLRTIQERAPLVVREYRDRLLARVNELISNSSVQLAEQDLLKEVSIYAERSDISEELSRLSGHLEQFTAALAADGGNGRKLEFIAQEMLREANTIGSKTGDATIAREIVEVKGAVDRIKEQVQNVE